jgi:hypothetical protein
MIAIPYRNGYGAVVDAMVGQGPRDKIQSIGLVQANLRNNGAPIYGTTSGTQLNIPQ